MKNTRVAIIPARGGSKRLAKKNILKIKNKPLIAWTIEEALKSNLFERVFVSTESDEIASIASSYGAEILNRPNFLATDSSKLVDVCEWHLKNFYKKKIIYDEIFCLIATAPLRNANDLKAIARILDSDLKINAVMAVTNFFYYPHQAVRINKSGFIEPYWPNLIEKRSNELDPLLVDNGSTYALKVDAFLKEKTFYLKKGLVPYFMEKIRSIDIDDLDDFKMLNKIMDDNKNG